MNTWNIRLAKKAYKQLKILPDWLQDLFEEAVSELERHGPIPPQWDVKKIADAEYRIRLNYRYRMRYKVAAHLLLIEIFYIGHRKNAY